MQRFLHYEFYPIVLLDQIAFSWFIQNQIKGHAPSAGAAAYPEVGLVRLHSFKTLFNIFDCIRCNLH